MAGGNLMLLSLEVTEADSSSASVSSSFSTGLTTLLFRLRRKFSVREEMKMGALREPPDTLGKLGAVLAKRNCWSLARCLSFKRAANESGLRLMLDTLKLDKMLGTFSASSSSSTSSSNSSSTSSDVSFSTSSDSLMTELLTRFADDDRDARAGLMEELTMLLLLLNKLAEARFL